MATKCCWAPSWMSRSSRRRAPSWACDNPLARGLQLLQARLQLEVQAHVLEGRPRLRRQVGQQPVFGGGERLALRLADGDLSHRRALVETGTVRSNGPASASAGQATARSWPPGTYTRTRPRLAPTPCAAASAMRGSTSSTESAPAIRSEKSASTSYGLARWP